MKQEKRKPISVELVIEAQKAYQEAQKAEAAAKTPKAQLELNSGWGGKGR